MAEKKLYAGPFKKGDSGFIKEMEEQQKENTNLKHQRTLTIGKEKQAQDHSRKRS